MSQFSRAYLVDGAFPEVEAPRMPTHPRDSAALPATFEEDGVVLISNFLDPATVAELELNVERYKKWILPAVPADWKRHEADGTVRGMYYLNRADPYFEALGARDDIKGLVERATGRKLTFAAIETFDKPAKVGSPSLVHQDGIYFKDTSVQLINVWIAIDDAREENGALAYFRKSHRDGLYPHASIGKDDAFFLSIPPEKVAHLGTPERAVLPPGGAAIHGSTVVHGSPPNTSPYSRRALQLCYHADAGRA